MAVPSWLAAITGVFGTSRQNAAAASTAKNSFHFFIDAPWRPLWFNYWLPTFSQTCIVRCDRYGAYQQRIHFLVGKVLFRHRHQPLGNCVAHKFGLPAHVHFLKNAGLVRADSLDTQIQFIGDVGKPCSDDDFLEDLILAIG